MKKGSKMPESQKKKISESNKGKNKGKPAHNKGKPMSESQRKKLSDKRKGKPSPMKGKHHTNEAKRKNSEAHKGKNNINYGKHFTEEHKKKISESNKGQKRSDEAKRKNSEAHKGQISPMKGKHHSEETKQRLHNVNTKYRHTDDARRKISASQQHISYDEWESFACEKKYCPKFNEACKESNREKYGRRCFICNKTEKANGQKLSVHHVDMQKSQGCESNWKLVPLCKHCHATAHNDTIIARLGYIIKRGK